MFTRTVLNVLIALVSIGVMLTAAVAAIFDFTPKQVAKVKASKLLDAEQITPWMPSDSVERILGKANDVEGSQSDKVHGSEEGWSVSNTKEHWYYFDPKTDPCFANTGSSVVPPCGPDSFEIVFDNGRVIDARQLDAAKNKNSVGATDLTHSPDWWRTKSTEKSKPE